MPPTSTRADHVVRQLGERVAHDRRVVLAVDDRECARHRRDVTSPSIRAVYFSNSSVSVANWMIFSCPWNGYLRHTSTCVPGELDHVVTGPRVTAKPQGRDRAGVDDEEILEPPRVRHVLVPRQDEVDAGALQALDRVAGVVDDVALAPGARHRQQVVVADEDAQVGRGGELLLDPAVAAAADLAVVEVGLGRVDGDDRDAADARDGVPVAEQLLEMDVADVARVVVPGDHDQAVALDPVEVVLRVRVLLLEAEGRQVARADDHVRARCR